MTTTNEQPKSQSLTPQQMSVNHSNLFARYVTDTGKMLPRRVTGLSAKQQRHITRAIKQSRNLLMMQ